MYNFKVNFVYFCLLIVICLFFLLAAIEESYGMAAKTFGIIMIGLVLQFENYCYEYS